MKVNFEIKSIGNGFFNVVNDKNEIEETECSYDSNVYKIKIPKYDIAIIIILLKNEPPNILVYYKSKFVNFCFIDIFSFDPIHFKISIEDNVQAKKETIIEKMCTLLKETCKRFRKTC